MRLMRRRRRWASEAAVTAGAPLGGIAPMRRSPRSEAGWSGLPSAATVVLIGVRHRGEVTRRAARG